MKNSHKRVFLFLSILLVSSCHSDIDDCCGELEEILRDVNPENDPLSLGIEGCEWTSTVSGRTLVYPLTLDLPEVYDVGYLMPEPSSQGIQGSCASWATHYSLGTYMLNIATDSIIDDDSEIMSPSFAFNQLKESSGNCYGSSVSSNLSLMINTGALSILDFPYLDENCALQPDVNQYARAQNGIITSFESIGPYYTENTNDEVIAPIIDELKSAIIDGHPVVISMMVDVAFGNQRKSDVFMVQRIFENGFRGCHAMTVVGYNDDLKAFRVMNSWGSSWANNGYIYVSYDFFSGSDDPDFKIGVLDLTVAFSD
jgi:C1A family cysteine protease